MIAFRFGFGALGAALLVAVALCAADTVPGADNARADLAKRLKVGVDEITVEKAETVTWPDGSLGLPRPGMMYTMALVPGARLELKCPQGTYFYHVGGATAAYAGRAELWNSSALYLEPVEDEPNLNGNLVQVSLLGTNPVPLLNGVTDFAPQANGSVLATRRTSRSGFGLLYLAPEAKGEAKVLADAFEFACPVLAPQGDQYAVFFRPMLGMEWGVERGSLDGQPTPLPDLPVAGRPYSLAWREGEPLLATVRTDKGLQRFKLVEQDGVASWEAVGIMPEGEPGFSVVLNKSYNLEISGATAGDPPHPVTRVYSEHFLGTQEDIVVLDNFALTQVEVSPDLEFALLTGQRDDKRLTLTVDLRTGENWETVRRSPYVMHLLARPAHWGEPVKGM